MASARKNHRQLPLRLFGGVVLCTVIALPVLHGAALAQETMMRSGINPESKLAQSPLSENKEKLGRKNLQKTALNPTDQYKTETISDADLEAEVLQRLYGNSTDSTDDENGNKPKAKPQATALRDFETELSNDPSAEPETIGAAQKSNKTAAKTKQTTSKINGKTTIDPGLDAQTTGTLVVRKGQKAQMLRAQPAIPVEAVQSRDLTEEENPFKAVGIRVGSITLRPALEQGLEVTNNNTVSAGGDNATSSVTTLRLDGASDWRDGSLETTGFLTLRRSFSANSKFESEAGASFKLTQPILREWSYTVGGSYGLKRESAVSGSGFATTITKRPLAQDFRLSLGVGKSEGILQPSAKLELGRLTFGNATNSLGASISQSDRDQTSLRGTFRLGTEISPALTPFVEVAYGKTWRDETVDVFGNDRSATDLRASIGAELNFSEKTNGEFSVGWLRQSYDTGTLSDIDGVALAAALNWSPAQGTIVTAGLTTSAEPANSATVSGSLLYGATLGVSHQLSSRWSTSANFGVSYRDFTAGGGNDTALSAELAATYMVNRMLGINAKARHEAVSSSDPLRESDTTTLLLGLKIQR